MPFKDTSHCTLKEMPAKAEEIYLAGSIPVICASDDDKASMVSTFWAYKGDTVLETKPLVAISMNQGKTAAWEKILTPTAYCVDKGSTLVLHMGNGVCDILGIAKEADPEHGETMVQSMFDTTAKDAANFAGLKGTAPFDKFVHPEFKVYVVSEFTEEDIADFYDWGPFPLESCHLLVVNES